MSFTALATRVYKDPLTTVYLNSLKQNDDYLVTGVAKAYITFDMSAADASASIKASQNIASIVDVGAGRFQLNFTTGMSIGSGYVPVGIAESENSDNYSLTVSPTGGLTSGNVNFTLTDSTDAETDSKVYVVIFGAGK